MEAGVEQRRHEGTGVGWRGEELLWNGEERSGGVAGRGVVEWRGEASPVRQEERVIEKQQPCCRRNRRNPTPFFYPRLTNSQWRLGLGF